MTNQDKIRAALPKGTSILSRACALAGIDIAELRNPSDEVTAKILAAITSMSTTAAAETISGRKLAKGDKYGDGRKYIDGTH